VWFQKVKGNMLVTLRAHDDDEDPGSACKNRQKTKREVVVSPACRPCCRRRWYMGLPIKTTSKPERERELLAAGYDDMYGQK